MPLNVGELYDPIENAPVASFADAGDSFAGNVIQADWRDDKYGGGKVPAITLQLDHPLEDDEYVTIFARSAQLQREIGKAAAHAGRATVTVGDWMCVEYVEERESANGNTYKVYEVGYKPGDGEKPGGAGLFAEGGPSADDAPPF